MKISEILVYLDTISPLLLLFFILFKRNEDWRRDFVLWFILLQAVLNSVAIFYDQVLLANNLFLYDINCFLSFTALSVFFHLVFKDEGLWNLPIYVLGGFVIFFFANLYWGDGLNTFNSLSYGVASSILALYCFIYYLRKLLNPITTNIARSRVFWYVTGIFTYYSGSFFIFITYSYLTQRNIQELHLLWKLHNFIFFLMCVYLFLGLLCKPLPKRYKL